MKFNKDWPLIGRIGFNLGILFVLLLISGGIFRGCFFTFVDGHEVGYLFNKSTGEITVLDRTGYFWVVPYYTEVHTIDGRPMQVRIEANNRVLNAKLVRFHKSPEAVKMFIQMHGLKDYEATSSTGSSGNLSDILKSYAYENVSNGGAPMSDEDIKIALEKKYPFLEILSSGTNTMQPAPVNPDSLKVKQQR